MSYDLRTLGAPVKTRSILINGCIVTQWFDGYGEWQTGSGPREGYDIWGRPIFENVTSATERRLNMFGWSINIDPAPGAPKYVPWGEGG